MQMQCLLYEMMVGLPCTLYMRLMARRPYMARKLADSGEVHKPRHVGGIRDAVRVWCTVEEYIVFKMYALLCFNQL